MALFKYKALKADGKEVEGIQEADTSALARKILASEKMLVLDIQEIKKEITPSSSLPIRLGSYSPKELALVTKQLSTLIGAGLPLAESLEILIRQISDSPYETLFRDVRERITQGQSLGDAFEAHPRAFPPLFVNMIRAGEASGKLDLVFQRLAEYVHKSHQVRSKVINAFTYPMVMVFVGIVVVIFLLTFVVPKIALILKESKKVLPLPTKILLATSHFFLQFWWALFILIPFLMILYRMLVSNPKGRYLRDKLILSFPLLGPICQKHLISRFALTFSTLLKSGIPALEALEIVTPVVGNKVMEEVLIETRQQVLSGSDISSTLSKSQVFPPLVSGMIGVGEHSGNLEEMLEKIAQHFEEEIDLATNRLLSLLEPALIVIMAVVVGFIVLSIILPILSLSDIAK
ncbi:MAG: type II secretion system protein GspF [Planctomycetota bacterium]|nr:MAG: type II secretion system protein GspF [Planctomycetota bacterium]